MNWLLIVDIALDLIDKFTDSLKNSNPKKSGNNKSPDFLPVIVVIIFSVIIVGLKKLVNWLEDENKAIDDGTIDSLDPQEYTGSINLSDVVQGRKDYSGKEILRSVLGRDYVVTSPHNPNRVYNGHKGHAGTDLRAAVGSPLYAPFNGKVTRVHDSLDGLAGKYVDVVDETGSIVTRVMHLSEIGVKVGQSVTKGEQIGKTGASGKGRENGYSPHLHLSLGMIENGKYRWVNAEKWEMKTSLDEVSLDETSGSELDNVLSRFNGNQSDNDLVDFIIKEEGFLEHPKDIGDGLLTIGSGLTAKRWHDLYRSKGRWSVEDNKGAVHIEVAIRRKWLESNIPHWSTLPVNSQKALISYKYNFNFTKSNSPKLFKALADKNYVEAARHISAKSKNPNFRKGLRARRLKEQALFLSGFNLRLDDIVMRENILNKPTVKHKNTEVVVVNNETLRAQ